MGKIDENIVAKKGNYPLYVTNPSITGAVKSTSKRVQIGNETQGLVVDQGTGEVLGHGVAMAYKWQEVDSDKFVKLYLAGIRQAIGLSKAGLAVFEIVYKQLQGHKEKDTVQLSLLSSGLTKTKYYDGVKELLDREFLYKSQFSDVYFVNIQYLFNGDRLAFVQGYYRKGTPNPMSRSQSQLSLLEDEDGQPKNGNS